MGRDPEYPAFMRFVAHTREGSEAVTLDEHRAAFDGNVALSGGNQRRPHRLADSAMQRTVGGRPERSAVKEKRHGPEPPGVLSST